MKKRKFTGIAGFAAGRVMMILFAAWLSQGCDQPHGAALVKTEILMGTYVTITCYDHNIAESDLAAASEAAFAAMRRIEKKASPYDSSTVIARLNRQQDMARSIVIDKELRALIRGALDIASASGGNFDFTLWPVFQLWQFDTDSARVPPLAEVRRRLAGVDYRRVTLKDSVLTLQPGVAIDFSGISKGFGVEVAREVLKSRGLANFMIDAGGNLGIEWHHERPLRIGVRHPRKTGELWGYFPVIRSCGIATSGDYHISFEENGRRYHHLLDPRTGMPAERAVSATIIAANATLADGFSTAIFVMGAASGGTFLEEHPELQGTIIYQESDRLTSYLSPELRESFHLASK